MAIELMLLKDVKDLGNVGDTVNVAPGYARNYLIPKKMAEKVTPGVLRQVEARKKRIEAQLKDEREKAQILADKIANTEITISMQADDDEKLFGSVSTHMIAEALEAKGISVDSRKINLAHSIKELGVFDVEIKLCSDVLATIKVWVIRA